MKTQAFINDYLRAHEELIRSLPQNEIDTLLFIFRNALQEEKQIFAFGNGGSAMNASHFITDLSKAASDKLPTRFKGLCLNESISWITALGNDYAFEDVFVRQLMNFAKPGDIVFVMSVSGSSPNIVKAVEWAKENSVYTIALTGKNNNQLKSLADFHISVASSHYGRVEDAHMHICHMICYAFIEGIII